MITGTARTSRTAGDESPVAGFTLLEILIAVALIGTLAAIAVPNYFEALNTARVVRAKADIKNISTTIDLRRLTAGGYPGSLAEVGCDQLLDPWGHPYEYLKIEGLQGKGQVRKDRNLVPINSDYDLYSIGKDGRSTTPLTARISLDDIVRANNGAFIGLAADY